MAEEAPQLKMRYSVKPSGDLRTVGFARLEEEHGIEGFIVCLVMAAQREEYTNLSEMMRKS